MHWSHCSLALSHWYGNFTINQSFIYWPGVLQGDLFKHRNKDHVLCQGASFTCHHAHIQQQLQQSNRACHVTLVAITGTIIMVPYLPVKSLQLIWKSGIRRQNLTKNTQIFPFTCHSLIYCICYLSWQTTFLERPPNSVVALYGFPCTRMVTPTKAARWQAPMEDQDWWKLTETSPPCYIDGLVQKRCNSSALAMELHLSCINPLICK